ncbi:MAG: SelB C-terminal domain-containing protein [Bacteroidia bacterium]|nr:SelB C-terminal domain-containing protein [Bacteroidia bacterium]
MKKGKTWILKDHKIIIPDDVKQQIDRLESKILNYYMQTPLMSELEVHAFENKIPKDKLIQYLKYLVNEGKIYVIEDNYIHANIVDECRIKLLYELYSSGKGITIAGFRDLINGNRKLCLLLMSQYDNEGMVARDNDLRYITEKGKKLLTDKN